MLSRVKQENNFDDAQNLKVVRKVKGHRIHHACKNRGRIKIKLHRPHDRNNTSCISIKLAENKK